MANQPPTRPGLRFPSVARPTPAPAPAPAPAAAAAPAPTPAPAIKPPQPQPRPPLARPALRPITQTQPTQPQQPTTTLPAPVNAPVPAPATSTNGVASLPTSLVAPRAYAPSSSLPASPIKTTTGSVPSPPKLGDAVTTTTSSPVPSFPALRPVATISSVPTSPAKPLPTTSSVSTSPESKPVTTTSSAAITREPNPPPSPSPRTIQPAARAILPESPKLTPSAPPPSPLIHPPAQKKSDEPPKIPLEAEQKFVLVQKTIDKPKVAGLNGSETQRVSADPLDPSIDRLEKLTMSKDMKPKGKIHGKKISSDSEETGMRVITIAGENKGAFMEVFHSPKKHAFKDNNPHHLHMKGNPKNDEHEWGSYSSYNSSNSEEGKAHKIKSNKGKGMTASSRPMSAFMNSNVQGVNNSVVYNSSCTYNDPGVHVAVSRKPEGGGCTSRTTSAKIN